jgi:putative transposase
VSKSAASRHFVALSAARMKEWMGADLSGLDIMVVQIDGIHISEDLVLVPALGSKRPTIHVCDIIVADDMFAL